MIVKGPFSPSQPRGAAESASRADGAESSVRVRVRVTVCTVRGVRNSAREPMTGPRLTVVGSLAGGAGKRGGSPVGGGAVMVFRLEGIEGQLRRKR